MSRDLELWTKETDQEVRNLRAKITFSKVILIALLILPIILFLIGDPSLLILAILSSVPPTILIVVQRIMYKRRIKLVKQLLQPPSDWFEASELNGIIKQAQRSLIPNNPSLDVRISITNAIGAGVYSSGESTILVCNTGFNQSIVYTS